MTRSAAVRSAEKRDRIASRMPTRCATVSAASTTTGMPWSDPRAHRSPQVLAVALTLEPGQTAYARYRCDGCGAVFDGPTQDEGAAG
jgi:hypothetical protein